MGKVLYLRGKIGWFLQPPIFEYICHAHTYTDHNSKFRLSENILGPYLKVTQSPILAILCVLLWVGSIATSKYDPNLPPEKTKFRIAIGIMSNYYRAIPVSERR